MNTYRDDLEDRDDDEPPSGGWDLFFHLRHRCAVAVLAFAVARDTALFGRPEEGATPWVSWQSPFLVSSGSQSLCGSSIGGDELAFIRFSPNGGASHATALGKIPPPFNHDGGLDCVVHVGPAPGGLGTGQTCPGRLPRSVTGRNARHVHAAKGSRPAACRDGLEYDDRHEGQPAHRSAGASRPCSGAGRGDRPDDAGSACRAGHYSANRRQAQHAGAAHGLREPIRGRIRGGTSVRRHQGRRLPCPCTQ